MQKTFGRRLFAFFMAIIMTTGMLAASPTQVQANPPTITNFHLSGDNLHWAADFAPGHVIEFVSGSMYFSNAYLGSTTSGVVNLNHTSLPTGTHTITARIYDLNNWGIPVATTGSVTWSGGLPQLPVLTGLTVNANNVISWNHVAGATMYHIFVDRASNWSNIVSTSTTSTSYNLTPYLSQFASGEGLLIFVVATANGHLDSSAEIPWTAPSTTLSAPTLSVNTLTGVLSWNPIPGATSYAIYMEGRGTYLGHVWGNATTTFDLRTMANEIPTGNQRFTVRAGAPGAPPHGNWSPHSNIVTFNLHGSHTLSAPTGLNISGTWLSWNQVSNAHFYRVYVNNTPRSGDISSTSFNLASLNLTAANHSIQVRAIGNGSSIINSPLSSPLTFNPHGVTLSAPTNVRITSTSTLQWNSVTNASSYRVYVGGTARGNTTTATSMNLNNLNLGTGTHSIQVRALGNSITTHNSTLSSSVNFTVGTATPTPSPTPAVPAQLPQATNLHLQGNVLHWVAVPNATSYTIYVGGIVRSAPTFATHFSLSALGLPAGNYSIQIRAHSNVDSVTNSDLSQAINFTTSGPAQPTPTPTPEPTPQPEQPSGWANGYISSAISAGLVPQNLQFSYAQATTRAEFAALAVALYETVRGYEIQQLANFNDTDDINVRKMGALGVVLGTGHGDFLPNDTLTREQAAVMLARLAEVMGQPLPHANTAFADNATISAWAIDAVGRVQAAGIMEGVGNNMFDPLGEYTREQSIVTMLRMFEIKR